MSGQMAILVMIGPKRRGARAFGVGYADQRFEQPGIWIWFPGHQFRAIPISKRRPR